MLIGRKKELELLRSLIGAKKAALVVIKGRRRIGKTRLARESAKGRRLIEIAGIPPDKKITAKVQMAEFLKQFGEAIKLKITDKLLNQITDWSDIFRFVSRNLKDEPQVLFFDEISWLAAKDTTFVPKFKNWWDKDLSRRVNLTVILSGSVSTWINKNIVNSTALFGRINLILTLPELSITESAEMIGKIGCKFSDYETYAVLSILGGVPWYIEQLDKQQSAIENINRLCFSANGLLVDEFDRIFFDVFSRKGDIYYRIVEQLTAGEKELGALRESLGYSSGGALTKHLKTLCESGFVGQHDLWNLKRGQATNRTLYRLRDSYLKFFIRAIRDEKLKFQLLEKSFSTPGFQATLGLGLENLIINNINLVLEKLRLRPEEILNQGPVRRKATNERAGYQIDFLIQTRTKSLYVCEIKFSTSMIGTELIDEVQKKITGLNVPRGFAVIPVLITNAEISKGLADSNFFGKVIEIGEFLR